MVRWMRWHCTPALAVWGWTRYLSVTEAPHNTDLYTWMGKKHFCFFQTAETGNRTPNSSVKAAVLTTTLSGPNPLNPHDASKHNCVYMKNDLISYTQGFQNDNFHGTVLIITLHFFHLSYSASHLHPSQLENCDSNSRLCKFRLESRTYLPV